jgi:hypothetical protein
MKKIIERKNILAFEIDIDIVQDRPPSATFCAVGSPPITINTFSLD